MCHAPTTYRGSIRHVVNFFTTINFGKGISGPRIQAQPSKYEAFLKVGYSYCTTKVWFKKCYGRTFLVDMAGPKVYGTSLKKLPCQVGWPDYCTVRIHSDNLSCLSGQMRWALTIPLDRQIPHALKCISRKWGEKKSASIVYNTWLSHERRKKKSGYVRELSWNVGKKWECEMQSSRRWGGLAVHACKEQKSSCSEKLKSYQSTHWRKQQMSYFRF